MVATLLNLLGAAIYCTVITACILAWRAAALRRRPPSEQRHWVAIAMFFTVILLWRLFGIEENVRTWLRASLLEHAEYTERWEFQAPVAASAVIIIALAVAAMLFLHPARRPPPKQRSRLLNTQWIADLAVAAMTGLVCLRLISLHAVDSLLYHGPHLNWVADIGSSAVAFIAALQYRRLLLAPPK